MEGTASREGCRIGRKPWDGVEAAPRRMRGRIRQCGEKRACVWVERLAKERFGRGMFDDLAGIHDGYQIAELRDNGQIVADEEDG